jgi:hypothetical protein
LRRIFRDAYTDRDGEDLCASSQGLKGAVETIEVPILRRNVLS